MGVKKRVIFPNAEARFDESEHPRDEHGRFADKPVLYESPSGGSIVSNYTDHPREEKENLDALKTFADSGESVVLLKADSRQGVRTPDCTRNGVDWEVKTNYKPTVSAIDHALRSCNGQSKNLILNVTSDISDEDIFKGIDRRIKRTDIENIVVERNGKVTTTYTRSDFA